MNKLIDQLEDYLWETLGIRVVTRPWSGSSQLPQYLRDSYRFFEVEVLGKPCLLMVDSSEVEQTPAVIAKHLSQVRSRQGVEAVYVRNAVTSYNRRRLIEHKASFIVPGNQMYLPLLGLDLREHLKRLREKKRLFSPSTQALVLYVLYHHGAETVTPAEIASRLGYSAMSMTRAFDELEGAGVGEHFTLGRERRVRLAEPGMLLWEKALPYLSTPVRRRISVGEWARARNDILAGESALAEYTMLAEPKAKTFALSAGEWQARMKRDEIRELPATEEGAFQIEIWKYATALFAYGGKVDRLSLYLSLKDSGDERVQSALDELLEGMPW